MAGEEGGVAVAERVAMTPEAVAEHVADLLRTAPSIGALRPTRWSDEWTRLFPRALSGMLERLREADAYTNAQVGQTFVNNVRALRGNNEFMRRATGAQVEHLGQWLKAIAPQVRTMLDGGAPAEAPVVAEVADPEAPAEVAAVAEGTESVPEWKVGEVYEVVTRDTSSSRGALEVGAVVYFRGPSPNAALVRIWRDAAQTAPGVVTKAHVRLAPLITEPRWVAGEVYEITEHGRSSGNASVYPGGRMIFRSTSDYADRINVTDDDERHGNRGTHWWVFKEHLRLVPYRLGVLPPKPAQPWDGLVFEAGAKWEVIATSESMDWLTAGDEVTFLGWGGGARDHRDGYAWVAPSDQPDTEQGTFYLRLREAQVVTPGKPPKPPEPERVPIGPGAIATYQGKRYLIVKRLTGSDPATVAYSRGRTWEVLALVGDTMERTNAHSTQVREQHLTVTDPPRSLAWPTIEEWEAGDGDTVEALRARLREQREQHLNDVLVLSQHMAAEAKRRGWCAEYDAVMVRSAVFMTVPMAPREPFHYVNVTETYEVQVTRRVEIKAMDADAALTAARTETDRFVKDVAPEVTERLTKNLTGLREAPVVTRKAEVRVAITTKD